MTGNRLCTGLSTGIGDPGFASRETLICSGAVRLALLRSRRRRLRQRFLVAPHRQRKGAACYFEMFGHDSSAKPAALFVKPGGTVVSNCASKPGCAHAAFSQMCFCIGNQRSGDTGPSRPRGTHGVGRARRPLPYKSRLAHRLVRRPAHSPRSFEALLRNSRAYAPERVRTAGFVHVRLASPHTRSSPTARFQLRGHP